MRRLFIFSLLAIVLALWVTLYLGFPADPGYLLIAFGNYTFETSLFALLVALAVAYLIVRLIMLLLRTINPYRWFRAGRELANRSRSRKRSRTVEGLLYLTRRNWQLAYNTLLKSAYDEDASVVNYLAAAYAAYELGQREHWQKCLHQAEREYPAAHTTIHTLKVQLLYKTGQLEQCLAMAEMLRKNSLNDPPLLQLLKEVYLELEEWEKLQALIPALRKSQLIDADTEAAIEKQALMAQLRALANKTDTESARDKAVARMRALWKKTGRDFNSDAGFVLAYADLLFHLEAREEAAEVIEKALNETWSRKLVLRFAEWDFGVSDKQLSAAERWLKSRANDPDLLLSLARLSMRNQLWGKAREYYQASIRISPSAEAYAELGRLLKHLGEDESSATCLQNYSEFVGANLPELPLPQPQAKVTH